MADPEAEAYLQKLQTKINTLIERFASGDLNRRQFENLHNHYRSEIEKIEHAIEGRIAPEQWKKQITEGQTILLRRLNTARMIAFSVYENRQGKLLAKKGDFPEDEVVSAFIDESLAAMQHRQEPGVRLTRSLNQVWGTLVLGDLSATLVILSDEPSPKQLHILVELHSVFENANRKLLELQPVPNHLLALPHQFYLNKAL